MRQFDRVSVVIPTYNRKESLARCLRALFASELGEVTAEICVCDDGSTDGTSEMIQAMSADCPPGLTLKHLVQQNGGPSAARNRGIREATADLILFTDDDCEPDPGWIRAMATREWPDQVGGVAGRTKSPPANANWVSRYCRHIGFNEFPNIRNEFRSLQLLNTANCAYLRQPLVELEGFDLLFSKVGHEDVDLTRRLVLMGYCLEFEPRALVTHHHRENLESFWKAFYKRGHAETFLPVMWGLRKDGYQWRDLFSDTRFMIGTAIRFLIIPFTAMEYVDPAGSYKIAVQFAFLSWYAGLARNWGEVQMVYRLITGRQSRERSSKMPEYSGDLRKAVLASRRRQRHYCAELQKGKPHLAFGLRQLSME
jgi:glycosyltransferase involved in cell wall biosynthesis